MESPASNTTTPSHPAYSWVENPRQRDTFGILSFSLTTMIICVWSAVHLDIPNTRHSPTRHFLTRLVWMLIALIAPEVLLFLAINQRIQAHALGKKAAKYLQSQPRAKPGMLARGFNYILRRAEPDGVSTHQQALNTTSNSRNMAGDPSPCRADNSTSEVPPRSRPCVLCDHRWF
jgi:hypothetical protein